MKEIKVVRSLDEVLWRQFLLENPTANIFHTPEMFRVFSQAKGYMPHLWAAVDQQGQPRALLLSVKVTLMNGWIPRLTTRAIAYGSVLCGPDVRSREALNLLLQAYKREEKEGALFSELRNLSDLGHLQEVLNEQGFVYEDHLNYLINLNRPAEEILQSMGQRTRKKIRKSLRDGVVNISEVTCQAELEDWYNILQKTYGHAKVPLADRSLFVAAFNELYPKGMAKFLLVKIEDTLVASSVELLFKDIIYGWYGGSDRAYSEYIPNERLIWYILEWGANNGYAVYDFGGAGKPEEEYGVRDFKAKFGGDLVNFGRNTWVHNPTLLQFSKQGYQFYRRFRMGAKVENNLIK